MKKFGLLLLATAAVSFTACTANKTEATESATSGYPIEESSATDQAETTITLTDSAAIVPSDSTSL